MSRHVTLCRTVPAMCAAVVFAFLAVAAPGAAAAAPSGGAGQTSTPGIGCLRACD